MVSWPSEGVGDETSGKRSNNQRRDDYADEEVIGSFALLGRFNGLSEVEVSSYSFRTLRILPSAAGSSSKNPKLILVGLCIILT